MTAVPKSDRTMPDVLWPKRRAVNSLFPPDTPQNHELSWTSISNRQTLPSKKGMCTDNTDLADTYMKTPTVTTSMADAAGGRYTLVGVDAHVHPHHCIADENLGHCTLCLCGKQQSTTKMQAVEKYLEARAPSCPQSKTCL